MMTTSYRPAGLSDDDSDLDDYDGFYDKPIKKYTFVNDNPKKKIESQLQDAIINSSMKELEKIVISDLAGNVDTKLDSGWTPLMHACFHAQERVVDYLLGKGADPNLHSDSMTPLMVACSNKCANEQTINSIVNKLISKDCLMNIGDKHGQTPLMKAISNGLTVVAVTLIMAKVNIEMRDNQGWTALFWAVHTNRPSILELLIASGARIQEVDRQNRTPADIADQHGYDEILEILNKHENLHNDKEMERVFYVTNKTTSWHDYYPGLEDGFVPDYSSQIPTLLYGMNCDSLIPAIDAAQLDLRSFLLLDESDLDSINISMPFEQQKLLHGLRSFHLKDWKLKSVAGLYVKKSDNYGVLECLSTLGAHLHQVYILETTLQYVAREYRRVSDPADVPADGDGDGDGARLDAAVDKLRSNIGDMLEEVDIMKALIAKINAGKSPPAEYIYERRPTPRLLRYACEAAYACSAGLLLLQLKRLVERLLK